MPVVTGEILIGLVACVALAVTIWEKIVKIRRRTPSVDQHLADHDGRLSGLRGQLIKVENDLRDFQREVDGRVDHLTAVHRESIGKLHGRLDTICTSLAEIAGTLKMVIPKLQAQDDRLNRLVEKINFRRAKTDVE